MPGASSAFIVAGVLSVLLFLYSAAAKPVTRDPKSGKLVIQYHPALRYLSLVLGLGMSVVLIVVMVIAPFKEPQDPYIAGGLLLLFLMLGGCLFLESKSRVELDENGVSASSAWRRPRTIRWADVAEVTYSSGSQWFTIISNQGEKIRAHTMMRGMREFCQTLAEKVSAEKLTRAVAGFKFVDKQRDLTMRR
jgi:hypothetical protein